MNQEKLTIRGNESKKLPLEVHYTKYDLDVYIKMLGQLPGERPRETAQPNRHVRRKGSAPVSGKEEQTVRAISAYAQYACLLSFQMGCINQTRLARFPCRFLISKQKTTNHQQRNSIPKQGGSKNALCTEHRKQVGRFAGLGALSSFGGGVQSYLNLVF